MTQLARSFEHYLDIGDRYDTALFVRLAGHRSRMLDRTMSPLAMGADNAGLWCPLAATMAISGRRAKRAARRAIGSYSVAAIITDVALKRSTRRRRPPLGAVRSGKLMPEQPDTTSFPSGHAATAAAFAVAATMELGWHAAPLAVLAAAVSYSRIYSGAHYPGDVAAGIAFGALVAGTSSLWWPERLVGPI